MFRHAGSLLALIALLVSGCALQQQAATAPVAEIPSIAPAESDSTADAPLPPIDGFLALEPEMRTWVHQRVGGIKDRRERMRQLVLALLDPATNGIAYDATLTRSAPELFRYRTGNCLSFSGLFVVLAREAGIKAWFQDVPVLPNWRLDGDAFVVERHINAVARIGRDEYVIDFRPPSAMARTRTRRISDSNATAQYFGNLGVERFRAGDLRGAYALFRRGLEADPGAASLWINLGVVLGRTGDYQAAARAYGQALAVEPGNLSAMSNLAGAEQARGNTAAARELQARVADYRAANPYYQYWLGEGRLQSGDVDGAVKAFRSALRQIPDEADFHFALARALHAQGREDDAQRSLANAMTHASTDGIRLRYRQRFEGGSPPG